MKIITSIKTMALMVAMMLVGTQAAEAKAEKPSGGSASGDLVISKVFYNNMINDEGKAYILANFLELYNNSTKELDITGIYIGIGDGTSSTSANAANAWTATNMREVHKDSIALRQIFRIPTDKTYTLLPGQSVVITNSAINHHAVAAAAPDMSGADFEVKSQHNAYKDNHNVDVPELPLVYSYSESATYLAWMSPGPFSVVLMAADTNLDKCPTGYLRDQTEGPTLFKFVPAFKTIDAVDIVEHSAKTEPDASQKRLPDSYDAGWTATSHPGANSGQAVVRKTAFITSDGNPVLYDTNNSSVDFEVTTDLSIRNYSMSPVGLTAQTVTIPESGYLGINTDKPFCSEGDVAFVHVNASNTAATTDLTYYEFPGDSILLIKGPWIIVGKPGEHTIYLSESQGVMRTRSSIVNWAVDDEVSVSQANRMFYKFSNQSGKVGFQRVPAVDGKYNKATFTDPDRLYILVTEPIADKIAAANGATGHADLDFIAWHGITPDEAAAAGISEASVASPAKSVIYNLSGQRLSNLQRGLNIVNGKKIVVK